MIEMRRLKNVVIFIQTNQKEFRIENRKQLAKRKGNKLFVKWKGYDNLFNCWIDKKDLV